MRAPIALPNLSHSYFTQRNVHGIALDIGSTTIVASLINLHSDKVLIRKSCINTQQKISADIIGRIEYAKSSENLLKLHTMLLKDIHQLLKELSQESCIDISAISEGVVAGNTAMLHFLTCRSPSNLGIYPFTTTYLGADTTNIFGIPCWIVPIIGSFIGGDTTCAILAQQFLCPSSNDIELLCDLGTNAEIVLRSNGNLFATSAAAGPAFEGAGIMASQLIAEISSMLKSGIVDETGWTASESIILKGGHKIKSAQIRALQTAKAAVAAAISTLAEVANIKIAQISRLYLAGAFASALDLQGGIELGIFPDVAYHERHALGNAALFGAEEILLNPSLKGRAKAIAEKTQIVELGGNPHFSEHFIEFMYFKKWQ